LRIVAVVHDIHLVGFGVADSYLRLCGKHLFCRKYTKPAALRTCGCFFYRLSPVVNC
jgi:hypothetical protein